MILKSETMNKITLYTIYNQLDKSYQEYVDIFSDFMEELILFTEAESGVVIPKPVIL